VLLAAGCGGAGTDGFDVSAPPGWKDTTDIVEHRSGETLQGAWQGPKDGDVASTIVIVRSERPAGVSLDALMEAGRAGMRRGGAAVGPVVPVRLGGAAAARFDYTSGARQVRQLAALRGDHVYFVTFAAARGAFDRRVATLDALLRSWRWST
jgi:hypothetical protein